MTVENDEFRVRPARRKFTMVAAIIVISAMIILQLLLFDTTLVNTTAPYKTSLVSYFTYNNDSAYNDVEVSPCSPNGHCQNLADYTNFNPEQLRGNESTCSAKASTRGPNQNVISFSFYGNGNHSRGYFSGIEGNIKLMTKLYPNWVMRVYHALSEGRLYNMTVELEQKYGDVLDFCFVGNLPGFGNLIGSQENMWRFLTLADPLVDFAIFRDLDSSMSKREVLAVAEWISSSYPMHVMRDHPLHRAKVLAGMWGARLIDGNRKTWVQALKHMLVYGQKAGEKRMDQDALAKYVWPLAEKNENFIMQHDSYNCEKTKYSYVGGMRRFPKCRPMSEAPNFVAGRITVDKRPLNKTCPVKCRPNPKCTAC